ncbi:hypothetical protein EDB84DRAFT_353406 [Lactarius hengduanensis]|nr:hypothetical protein EDB84DRAFT_353406 [Lactarius hengduanensis]
MGPIIGPHPLHTFCGSRRRRWCGGSFCESSLYRNRSHFTDVLAVRSSVFLFVDPFTVTLIFLQAAKDVRASHDALVDLFERIQFFLKRLGVHTRISPTKDMVEILVKITAEVISILSMATKEMQQSRTKIYIKKLLGRTDIEDALKKLDGLTQEEVRMAIAQVLQGINELKDDAKKVDEALREIKWNQIEQDIRRWFSSPDPSVNYNIARRIYQKGTAVWFLEGSIFKEWDLIGSLLWIHGKRTFLLNFICGGRQPVR